MKGWLGQNKCRDRRLRFVGQEQFLLMLFPGTRSVSGEHRPPLCGGCMSLKLFQSLSGSSISVECLVQVESVAQPGLAAKAAYSLERSCPMESMAPVLAIV
jgi:hypothetical protein